MSEISKINIGGTVYDIKDQSAREILGNINTSNNVSSQLSAHDSRISSLEGKFTGNGGDLMTKNGGKMRVTSGDTVATTSYVDGQISDVSNRIGYVSNQLDGISFRIV